MKKTIEEFAIKIQQQYEELQTTYEELQGSNEELIAANEESEAQNEELIISQEELQKNEEQYRMLAENTTDIIWSTDLNLKITFMSPAVTKMYGYSVKEAMELSFEKWSTPDSYKKSVSASHPMYSHHKNSIRQETMSD